MKFLLAAALLAFAPTAFAESVTYSGEGKYRTLDGDKGEYTVRAHLERQAKDTGKLTTSYTYKQNNQDVTREYSILIKSRSNGFFDILNTDEVRIGSGNCNGIDKSADAFLFGKKPVTCQYDFTINGNRYHEGFMARNNKVYRAGGVEYPNKRVAWTEKLTKSASSCDSNDNRCDLND